MKKQYAIISPVGGIQDNLPSILIDDIYTPSLSKNILFDDGVVKRSLGRKKLFYEGIGTINHTPVMTSNNTPEPFEVSANDDDVHAWQLLDGNLDTFWYGDVDKWWKIDFGSSKVVDRFKISAVSGLANWFVKDFTIEGSNDDDEWVELFVGETIPLDTLQAFDFNNTTAYRYYRINILTSHTDEVVINAMEFWYSGDKTAELNLLFNFEQANGNKFLVFGTKDAINYRTAVGTTNITGVANFTGKLQDLWSVVTYGDILILSNGVDKIYKWAGVGDIEVLGGTPPEKAKHLATFKNYLIAGNIDGSMGSIAWSGVGEHEKWNESDVGDSTDYGQALVSDTMPVTGFGVTSDYLIVYKQFSIHIIRFAGGDVPFIIEDRVKGVGTSSPKSVVVLNDVNFFLGTDRRVYAFDGSQAINISDTIKTILDTIKVDNLSLSYGMAIPERNLIIFAVACGDTDRNNTLLIYNTLTSAWTRLECPCNVLSVGGYAQEFAETWEMLVGTWDDQTKTWDEMEIARGTRKYLSGENDGFIYELFASFLDKEEEFTGEFITKKIEFGNPNYNKRILQMQHYFKNASDTDKVDISVRLDNDNKFTDKQVFDLYIPQEDEFIIIDQYCDYLCKTLQLKLKSSAMYEYIGTIFYYSDIGLR